MINKNEAVVCAVKEIIKVFDKRYFRDKINSPVSYSVSDNIFTLHYMFENTATRPDLKENLRGWTVFATAKVNMETGEAWLEDYILPDGTRKAS